MKLLLTQPLSPVSNKIHSHKAAQGIIFSADGQRLLVQFNVEKQIAVYANDAGRLRDTGIRVPLSAGPASIRSVPR